MNTLKGTLAVGFGVVGIAFLIVWVGMSLEYATAFNWLIPLTVLCGLVVIAVSHGLE